MIVPELIGRVVALYLKNELADDGGAVTDGTARYAIDCLSAEDTAAIAREILSDPSLAAQIDLKLPSQFLKDEELPSEVLTTYPATYYRNASSLKPALLVANTGDDEEQSLKEFTRIDAQQLLDQPELWVRVAGNGLSLSESHVKWWEKAIAGLQDLRIVSLHRLAGYVLRTREAVLTEGLPVLTALGVALPALHFPRDSVFATRVREETRGQKSAWKREFAWAGRNRACYLLKQTTSQLLLSQDDLEASFAAVRDAVPEALHATVLDFVQAASGWNSQAARLAECEWEQVKPLFDGVRREKFNLGRETTGYYEERESGLLTDDEREYLRLVIDRSATEATEEDAAFYESHRNELKEDRKLKSAWDRFVFGKARETEDFVAGLAAAMEPLFNQGDSGSRRRLKIRCDRATKKELRDLNVSAGLYFAHRYRGLVALLGDRVSWNVGQLFEFPVVVKGWEASRRGELNRSTARAALQLKFIFELEVELPTGGTQSYATQLIWKYNPNAVACECHEDWARLAEHPLVTCRAARELAGAKADLRTVDLLNVRTFIATFDRDRGSFVPVYKKSDDIALVWRANLEKAIADQLLSPETGDELRMKFELFETAYGEAIRGFSEEGLNHAALTVQLEKYADLLESLYRHAKGDRNRDLLLRPLMQIGAVTVQNGPPAAVVAPWHPLRLAAIHRKAHLVAALVRHLLSAEEVFFGDTRLFFKDVAQELAHPFYPEVVLGWRENRPELLALSDVVQDYSLHECPVLGDGCTEDTNENPTNGSNCVIDLIHRYLILHPHEQANMSVVLYNCDSARLPQVLVDKIGKLYEDEDDVRCQVLLRHADGERLRDVYKAIVGLSDSDPDSFNASEATQDFMARLRICIIADQAPPPDPKDGCPYDIVFSQDVIARHSRVEWYPESSRPVELESLVPARWSRRRPAAKDDMKSIVYLCCPVQSREGWSYLTALTTFLRGEWDEDETRRLLPARQLDFRDPRTAKIFQETHNLGNWVVNYDELLDRRQLLNQNVRVIRYKQSATQGRNLIISSTAPLGLLRAMVLLRIRELNLGLSEDECRTLAERFIQDANDVSGDIVLRAAKRGRNASELMGIVISRYLLRFEMGLNHYHGWYFLDDYADWLGQREEQIADILALSPEQTTDGRLRLVVLIAESKYIDNSNLSAKRKESQKQLRDTVKRVREAVFGSPERLDRDLWLARLSDLILDGVQFPASARVNLADWRRAVREGACEIAVRGYSHVFVSGPEEAADCSAFCPVVDLDEAYQEVYGRADLRELVLRYSRNEDPISVRHKVAGEDVWQDVTYRRPTDRMVIRVPRPRKQEATIDPLADPSNDAESEPDSVGIPANDNGSQSNSLIGGNIAAIAHMCGWAYSSIATIVSSPVGVDDNASEQGWLRQTESLAKHALQQFQLQAKLLSGSLTPNCALLKFAGSANLTIEQVNRRKSELLTTYGLKVVAVRPEAGAITLAVARPSRQVIRTPDLWARWQPEQAWGNRSLLVGVREDDGSLLIVSPGKQHAPHTLIAGWTGSGKSVLMQNIILSVAATNTPNQARIVLIDPKGGVDYFQFENLPHLRGSLIVDPSEASAGLEHLVDEMNDRYARLRVARVQNLAAYNEKVPERERLPVIWVIHDEFAEWMMVDTYKEAVASTVGRLGVKARAAGIHLVFAAQRPDANVMPMQLRANLGNRLILKVDSAGTSEIALGERGAEDLLGHGHLIAKLEGSPGLCYAQVPLAEPDFVDRAVAIIQDGEQHPARDM